MTATKWIWVVLAGIYAVFFSWYTSFGGPLTNEEIDYYMERFERSHPQAVGPKDHEHAQFPRSGYWR